jgi:PHD/YefM family antitoxin component YafN of YafNO toxin-antitoxin module
MATLQEQFVTDAKGKKTGVILSLKRYQKLMEDLHDLSVVAERRDETPISFDVIKRQLKKDGIL